MTIALNSSASYGLLIMQTAKKFFSLEGIDGSGKSTHIDMLVRALESEGYKVVRLREPGGAKISERIRELLLDPAFKGVMADDTELLLYNAARAQVIHEIIQPALDAGSIVIADRFAWSTFAYQGYARGLGADKVQRLTELTCGGCFPEPSMPSRLKKFFAVFIRTNMQKF